MITQAKRVAQTPYALLGLLIIAGASFAIVVQIQSLVIPPHLQFVWQVTTGSALISTVAYQWWLMHRRWIGKATRFDYVAHRWAGVIATFLFALHVARIGHTWMTAVTVVFFLIAVTGIMNKEIMRYQSRNAYLVWFALHIGLSAIFVPMVLTHVWVALAY